MDTAWWLMQLVLNSWLGKLLEYVMIPMGLPTWFRKRNKKEWSLPKTILLGIALLAAMMVIDDHLNNALKNLRKPDERIREWLDKAGYSSRIIAAVSSS